MEIRRSSDVLHSVSDVGAPSGLEVESARMHMPVDVCLHVHTHDGGMKDKLHHMQDRASRRVRSLRRDVSARVDSMRRTVSDKAESLKPMARDRMSSIQSKVQGQVNRIESDIRENPGKWAGIAAGAGLGIGLIGRILRHRSRGLPRLVVTESSC